MQNVANIRMAALHSYDRDTYDVVKWLEDGGQSKFKERIYLPPIISLGIKNQSLSKVIESCFQRGHLLVCTYFDNSNFRHLLAHLVRIMFFLINWWWTMNRKRLKNVP